MKSRIGSALLAACITFAVGVRPCTAWMAQPEPEAAHECCDEPGDHSHGQQPECELVCALASAEFLPADSPKIDKQQSVALAAPMVIQLAVVANSALLTHVTFRPPDHAPPLYILNSAFLL